MQLVEFLDKYGGQISATIEKNLTPIYNPLRPEGVEEYEAKISSLVRKPFPVQGEIIKGVSKALYKGNRRNLFGVGEMGVGKTFLGLALVNNSVKPQRVLVVCPTHLVEKWIRETKNTIPNVKVIDLTVKNVISILDALRHEREKPKNHEIYVISKEKAKLGYGWRPAAIEKKGSALPHCPDCFNTVINKDDEYVTWADIEKKRYFCKCGAALWQASSDLKRFPPAEYIKRYLKGFFDLVILDEIQDYKAGDSLQGRAMGSLLSSAKRCLCLTGTLNGGYADDLFYLLFRLDPQSLIRDGFGYHDVNKWLETYGVLETVKKLEDDENYYGRGKKKGEMKRKRPGVSPAVIGKYLLDKAFFVRLSDVIEGLPPYEENVVTVKMEEQAKVYGELEDNLREAVKKYKGRVLSSMLQSLLSYPDSCVQFQEYIEVKDKDKNVLEIIEARKIDSSVLLPKEKEFIKLVKKEKAEGRKVLCYLTFTNSRDLRPRLKKILKDSKVRVGILDVSVAPKKREAWINKHAKDIDVLICNAELVKTGLDLYDFPTVVFFQVGYNIFTLRQAARRSWRIGQRQPVRVFFFCYSGTMQEVALKLIAKKLEVALMVEGDLPEGLAEYTCSGDSIISEMGKALVSGGNYNGAEVAWANFRKREIEAQFGINGKDTIFSETSSKKANKIAPVAKTSIKDNVVIKVTVYENKKKRGSVLEVKYGELDKVLEGKTAQFCLF
jgi:SNF2 family DNA or RNA helicase